MDDLNVIDRFTTTFVTYIDSGFGLLHPDIAFLTTILVGIDITLVGLAWAFSEDRSVLPALIRKVLYVGAFAFILDNFAGLATVVFDSFAGLGLRATGAAIEAGDLMRPGFVAKAGYAAAEPLLEAASELMGPIAFFENFVTIVVLLFAWLVVLLAFFVLAIQLFITIIEFKLTTLAGFVLVPFALWNRTTFLAERVLGNVAAAGIKLMVLAVIVGIGSTLFGEFAATPASGEVTLEHAAATVLGALSIFMLAIFGPSIAAGLISGAPQLGAGAVAGATAGLALGGAAAAGASMGSVNAVRAGAGGATRAGASLAGRASAAYQLAEPSGEGPSTSGEVARLARAGHLAAGTGARDMMAGATTGPREAYAGARERALGAGRSPVDDGQAGTGARSTETPGWARRMHRRQHMREAVTVTAHTLRDGDRPASGDNPRLKEED